MNVAAALTRRFCHLPGSNPFAPVLAGTLLVLISSPLPSLAIEPATDRADAQVEGLTANALDTDLYQRLNAAALEAAQRCLKDHRCADDPLLYAPIQGLDAEQSRSLRLLARLAQRALDAYAQELSQASADPDSSLLTQIAIERLRLSQQGRIRLIGIGDYTLVLVHLRGNIRSPDGIHPAGVVQYLTRASVGVAAKRGRILLPIDNIRQLADLSTLAPRMAWRGAVIQEATDDGWQTLQPVPPNPTDSGNRRRVHDWSWFCDAACTQ